MNSDADRICLVLNRRKGFIKMALRFGVDLVPSFSFGENFIYDQVKSQPGKVIHFSKLSLNYLITWCHTHFNMRHPVEFSFYYLRLEDSSRTRNLDHTS